MRAYERLLQYARVYTTSDPESGTHPSAAREFDLAHMLVEEMKNLGIEDARVDEHCYVYGTLPATPGCEKLPALGLIAHMDTAPDAPGENVNPILHENYDGGDVLLPATTALGTLDGEGRKRGVLAGANVIMPNLSPLAVREKYMLYDGKSISGDDAGESLDILRRHMQEIGYELQVGRGDYKEGTDK